MFYMTAQPSLAAEMEKPPSGGFFAFGLTPGSPGSGLCRLPFAIRGMTSKHPAAGNRQFRAVQRIEMKFADAVRGKIVNLLGGDGSRHKPVQLGIVVQPVEPFEQTRGDMRIAARGEIRHLPE